MLDKITPIKDLRPRMQEDGRVEGTVIEVTPEEEQGTRSRKVASFTLQDETGRVRVVLVGRARAFLHTAMVEVGRPVTIRWPRLRKQASGSLELVIDNHNGIVDLAPKPSEVLRCFSDADFRDPAGGITRDRHPELYEKVPVTIQVPRGLLAFAYRLASMEGVPVEEFLARKLGTVIFWEPIPPKE